MNARMKFLIMYHNLPDKARKKLFYNFGNPISLSVCNHEVDAETELSKKILSDLGFDDD
jgi:hypothetical protein